MSQIKDVVKVVRDDPPYLKSLIESFSNWTGIEEELLKEPIRDISGDLWSEIRKFQAHVCEEIESRELDDEFKEYVKKKIAEMWRNINEKQKIGTDKLGIVVARHEKEPTKMSTPKDGKKK
jgi:hypothetical protein